MGKKNFQKTQPTYAIVVEGYTEKWYLQMFQKNEKNTNNNKINIEPLLTNKLSVEAQYDLISKLERDGYNKIFWIVDLDQIIHNRSIEKFNSYRKKLLKKDNIKVFINKPCFEFWIFLHFHNKATNFFNCKVVEQKIKSIIELRDYEKSKKFYNKENHDIYKKLKSKLNDAIKNAKNIGVYNEIEYDKALSEMYLFFETNEIKDYML